MEIENYPPNGYLEGVIDGFNGYKVKPGNTVQLKQAIEKIISMKEEKLIQFSINSRQLSQSILPALGAANLIGLINKDL